MRAKGKHAPRIDARRAARGFVILNALFLLLVLSALAVYMNTMGGVQHASVMLSVQGERANHAARSGVEWVVSDLVNNAGAGVNCSSGTNTMTFDEAALAGFEVSVTCSSTVVTEGAATYTFYLLDTVASFGSPGQPDFVQRRLQTSLTL